MSRKATDNKRMKENWTGNSTTRIEWMSLTKKKSFIIDMSKSK